RRTGPVRLDGRLDEQAWRDAETASGFVQGEPREGADPARPTEVRVLFDDEALWIGARMADDGPGAVADQLVRRDEEGQYDYVEVLLDPNLDRRTGYAFRVSASGVERDAYVFRDAEEDVDWDAVWTAATHVDSAGWTAEIRIPLSQIRYESRDGEQVWGFNVRRRRLASASVSYFSLRSRTVEGRVSQAGRLEGLRLAGADRRLEVRPYVAGELFTGPAEAGNPFFDGSDLEPRAGAGVQYGVGPNFTLDATINPDFGQVEVDPAVVNLTAFETFFPEKRSFFVQDARIFDYELSSSNGRLFFSRRIGREPQVDPPEGARFTDVPDRTTILGATKFTGRTEGGLSVGGLAAVTQREEGRALMPDGGVEAFVAEPAARYGVARVQQDFRDGTSRIGALLTAVDRSLPPSGELDRLTSSAFGLGLDFDHEWGGPSGQEWSVFGYLLGTLVHGAPEAMVEIQTNPQHYFQRPDADDLSVDSTATNMTGANWNVGLARQSAEHWTWRVELEQLTPGVAANDLGFLDQGEQFDMEGNLTYRDIDPGPLFRSWSVSFFTFHELRHELLDDPGSPGQWARAYKGGQFSLGGDFELHNTWQLDLGVEWGPEALSDTRTRGGPLMTVPASAGVEAALTTDPRKTVSLGPSVAFSDRYGGGGHDLELGMEAVVRPSPAFEVTLSPSVRLSDDAAQFVTSSDAVPYGPTFGTRHLFADLERTEFSMETRLSAALTPDLSLQLFAQPLISSGDFTAYKQLARPASFDFRRFDEGSAAATDGGVECRGGATCVSDGTRFVDFDDDGAPDASFPDQAFNLRSLRGNAVLRWEYRPGSTVFLVWQQDRRDEARTGEFDLSRDVDGLLGAPAENTFIVKVSHFLDL
ncbi:MAG: DUF5916 domain-containing protein, partial [Gemmatimonadota bacterium]